MISEPGEKQRESNETTAWPSRGSKVPEQFVHELRGGSVDRRPIQPAVPSTTKAQMPGEKLFWVIMLATRCVGVKITTEMKNIRTGRLFHA